jgi:hypothetical protein
MPNGLLSLPLRNLTVRQTGAAIRATSCLGRRDCTTRRLVLGLFTDRT